MIHHKSILDIMRLHRRKRKLPDIGKVLASKNTLQIDIREETNFDSFDKTEHFPQHA